MFARYGLRVVSFQSPLPLEAKESINLALPRFTSLLKQRMGDRYYANSSTRRNELFYFFSPQHPLDTFSLYVRPLDEERVWMVLGYMPMKVRGGGPDLARGIEVKGPANTMSAGFVLMMLAKKLLKKVRQSPSQFADTQEFRAVPV